MIDVAILILLNLFFVLMYMYLSYDSLAQSQGRLPPVLIKKRVEKVRKSDVWLNSQGDTILEMPDGFKVLPDGQIVLSE